MNIHILNIKFKGPRERVSRRAFVLFFLLFLTSCTFQDTSSNTNENSVIDYSNYDLAFVRDNTIYLGELNTQNEIGLNFTNTYSPAFFPSNFDIIFLKNEEPYKKFIKFNLKTGEEEFIYATKENPDYFTISPNSKYLLYLENQDLYLLDLNEKEVKKVGEKIKDPSWAGDSKSFTYVKEDGQVFIQEFSVKEELEESEKIWPKNARSPVFISSSLIVFEECAEEKCTIIKYDLYRSEKQKDVYVSDLRETEDIKLTLSPNLKYLLYEKIDPVTELPQIEVISIDSGEKINSFKNAFDAIWTKDAKEIIFSRSELDEQGKISKNIYLSDFNGTETKSVSNGENPAIK
ncbi:MAG: hypothetical protein ABIF17_01175 [Patescibacteria group bacterium]